MSAAVTSWALTLAVGIALGLGVRRCLCPGRGEKGEWWAAALAGLAGAAVGRLALDVSLLGWHSPFVGGVLGGLVVSLLWSAATRMRARQDSR
jgi:hypothetical protein